VALFCDVEKEAVIPLLTADTIYAVPLSLEDAGLGNWIVQQMGLTESVSAESGLAPWRHFVADLRRSKRTLRIAIVGKYVALEDSYLSVKESLIHAGMAAGWDIDVEWISSEDLERGRKFDQLAAMDGIVVPGGFGYRGIEGKIAAARVARERGIPYLGLCLGMQVMCIEFARCITGADDPNSTEFDIETTYPIIDLMPDQRDIADMGGTMRLGIYDCELQPETHAWRAYTSQGLGPVIQERHRHRFEFNNTFRGDMERNGMVFSGLSPDGRLVEIAELRDHPFMVGSQFHPEFKSRPNRPHPLFLAFVNAAGEHRHRREVAAPAVNGAGIAEREVSIA
jgi:CTP synthase